MKRQFKKNDEERNAWADTKDYATQRFAPALPLLVFRI
jgi:hypothetical protein